MASKNAIGILGGSFDPVHKGHLLLAREIQSNYQLEEIRFMPCCQNPLKPNTPFVTAEDRIHMLQLAIAPFKGFSIDLREILSQKVSYTIETLQAIRKELSSDTSLAWIMASDLLTSFMQWKSWQKIIDYAHLIIVTRPGHDLNISPELYAYIQEKKASGKEQLHQSPSGYIFWEKPENLLAISATEVRYALSHQKDIRELVPASVADYIYKHHLYCNKNYRATS